MSRDDRRRYRDEVEDDDILFEDGDRYSDLRRSAKRESEDEDPGRIVLDGGLSPRESRRKRRERESEQAAEERAREQELLDNDDDWSDVEPLERRDWDDQVEGEYFDDKGDEELDDLDDLQERPKSRIKQIGDWFLWGDLLTHAKVKSVYGYVLLVVALAFIYMTNVFSVHKLQDKKKNLTEEVKELRAKSMTIASERMQVTRQSSIIREVDRRGIPLEESLSPNKVIKR